MAKIDFNKIPKFSELPIKPGAPPHQRDDPRDELAGLAGSGRGLDDLANLDSRVTV